MAIGEDMHAYSIVMEVLVVLCLRLSSLHCAGLHRIGRHRHSSKRGSLPSSTTPHHHKKEKTQSSRTAPLHCAGLHHMGRHRHSWKRGSPPSSPTPHHHKKEQTQSSHTAFHVALVARLRYDGIQVDRFLSITHGWLHANWLYWHGHLHGRHHDRRRKLPKTSIISSARTVVSCCT